MDAPGRPMLLGTTEEFCGARHDVGGRIFPLDPTQIEEFKQEAQEEADMELTV